MHGSCHGQKELFSAFRNVLKTKDLNTVFLGIPSPKPPFLALTNLVRRSWRSDSNQKRDQMLHAVSLLW
jgi:hypothetical protein